MQQPADPWPFSRPDPDKVVLSPRPGAKPSAEPPVRIFLGTEEAQHRAERVFFYSIEKFRDPGRTYEIHLMKNVAGFDRRRWRTGFTNYRYAIPEFAGGEGKAIYNDVDQIYLADPALLFDLDLNGHGYLSISAKDTSVMLIDCARMVGVWNRTTAANQGKHALINRPSKTPGLWGKLDGHWNARDQEYVEGLTKCLHYTALHQQPWQPFPEVFSYHPNPLAYVWHDLEREADAQGYQVFGPDRPSPSFAATLERAKASARPGALPAPTPAGAELARELGVGSACLFSALPALPQPEPLTAGLNVRRALLSATPEGEASITADPGTGDGRADMVIARGLLEHVPPADLPWLLREAFKRAGKLLHATVPAFAADGLGSAGWWRKRLAEAARSFPNVSWHLEAVPAGGAKGDAAVFQVRRGPSAALPKVWALFDGDPGRDAQVRAVAEALGQGFEAKRVSHGPLSKLPNRLRKIRAPEGADAEALSPPWPDLVIAAGRRAAPLSAWIRDRSGGRTRTVHLGRAGADLGDFDLVVAQPQHRLPIRDNVLHVAAPLALPPNKRNGAAAESAGVDGIEALARPRTLVVLGPVRRPYALDAKDAARFAGLVARRLEDVGGGAVLWFQPGTAEDVRAAAREALPGAVTAGWRGEAGDEAGDKGAAREALLALIDQVERCALLGDDVDLLAAACSAGKPVDLFEPPRRHEKVPGGKQAARLGSLMLGGGTSYRGTPLQQHALARAFDELAVRGWVRLPRDPSRLHRALIARGLVTRIEDPRVIATRRPLSDLDAVVERVLPMLRERPAKAV